MITSEARCTRKINSRIGVAKASVNMKKTLFHQRTGLKFKEETSKVLHLVHSFCMVLQIGTLRKENQK